MKEWTLMFYFAGDNELAPVIVSQLKAIKDAGFHENIDVLVHFDPNEFGVPTRIYDVNRDRKKSRRFRKTMIGDGADPFVRNMMEDDVDPTKINSKDDRINAELALEEFLRFCRDRHQAKRYMLFLIGHGMVVGNDAFLPDANPVSAITLEKLGEILDRFTNGPKEKDKDVEDKGIKGEGGALELLVLHSCSMSAIEVAYELKGTANYLMASEGPSFVGTWPYRQLLKKTFKALENAKESAGVMGNPRIDIPELVESLYSLTLFNSTDYLLSGYSQDLALCSLDPGKFAGLTSSIRDLVHHLKGGLEASSVTNDSAATELGKRIKELVLLAHWEAQSYWGESYTDLFDFCRCLSEKCDPKDGLKSLGDACLAVMEKLDRSKRFQGIVVRSENFGSVSQYSHGLSIYFPWSRPVETVPEESKSAGRSIKYKGEEKGVLERYKEYVFTKELGDDSWFSFLETYFTKTKRKSRMEEDGDALELGVKAITVPNTPNPPSASSTLDTIKPTPRLDPVKPRPSVGADCSCSSIKNYPEGFVVTEGVREAFE